MILVDIEREQWTYGRIYYYGREEEQERSKNKRISSILLMQPLSYQDHLLPSPSLNVDFYSKQHFVLMTNSLSLLLG